MQMLKIMAAVIAQTLAAHDPDNAAGYAINADKFEADLTALVGGMEMRLAKYSESDFVVSHDAYGYFTEHFGLRDGLALRNSSAARVTPSELRSLRIEIEEHDTKCAFDEPQHPSRVLTAVARDADLEVFEIDPLGAALEPGYCGSNDHLFRALRVENT